MNKKAMLLAGVVGLVVVGFGAPHGSAATQTRFDGNTVVLAALTPEQQTECERERRALYARLSQCTTDLCRQEVQRDIDAHNARCQ